MPTRPRSSTGFTLIEVLIAITIFAIMSVMAFRVLTIILETRDRVDRENKKWREIATAVARIEQDLLSFRDRRIRDSGGIEQAALVGVQVPLGDQGNIMLTRAGYTDQPGARGAPQRVGYRVKDGILEQLAWPVLDQAQRTRPNVNVVLRGVSGFEVRYLDARNGPFNAPWLNQWPPPGTFQATPTPGTTETSTPPTAGTPATPAAPGAPGTPATPGAAPAPPRDPIPGAVEIALSLASGERITRVIPFVVRESKK